jgi:hypothetical protein
LLVQAKEDFSLPSTEEEALRLFYGGELPEGVDGSEWTPPVIENNSTNVVDQLGLGTPKKPVMAVNGPSGATGTSNHVPAQSRWDLIGACNKHGFPQEK